VRCYNLTFWGVSYHSKPIYIINRRWDPLTAVSSAGITTLTNMADVSLGLFTKPYMAYQKSRSASTELSGMRHTEVSSVSSAVSSSFTPRKIGSDDAPSESDEKAISKEASNMQPEIVDDSPNKADENDSTPVVESTDQSNKSGNSVQSSKRRSKTALSIAGDVAAASGRSLGDLVSTYTKGALVDMPLAAAEGLRVVPRMYGEKVRDHGQVTDWKSGFTVAGKTFGHGMYEGLTDIFVLPYREKQKKTGAMGVVTGVGKGVLSMATKTSSAAIGLVAYPADGISQSIRSVVMRSTRESIEQAKLMEGRWFLETEAGRAADQAAVVEAFDRMTKEKGNE
jgi:hypothetical protein